MTLRIENLVKKFNDFTAVNGLSLEAKTGHIFGLIGPNGSGKTTTFRSILGLYHIDGGAIYWNNQQISALDRQKLGFLPEERGIYPKMKVEEQLYFFGELKGKTKKELKPKIDMWLKRFDLEDRRKEKAQKLSKGNQQKLQLIASFLHEPEFLILDEPFSGLDPVNAELLKNAIIHLKEQGTSIIFSSHRMDHVEELCDALCLMKKGEVLYTGELLNLKKQIGRIKLTIKKYLPKDRLLTFEGVNKIEEFVETFVIYLEDEKFAKAIYEAIDLEYIDQFNLDYLSLEEIFKLKVGEINE